MTQQEWNNDFAARACHNEGFRTTMYHDSMGIPTIGIGFNLTRPDWQHGLFAAGVPSSQWDAVKAGSQSLTVAQVQALFTYSSEPVIPQSRAELDPGHFDAMADATRCAFADLDFNMGEDGLDQFIGFRGLMNQGCHYKILGQVDNAHAYFVKAADDLESTAYATQVGARAKRNGEMIRTGAYVAIDAYES